jgi:hypothetical protein
MHNDLPSSSVRFMPHSLKYLFFITIHKVSRYYRPPLWSSGQSCLVVRVPGYRSRGSGFDSRRYQIFWEVVGLERGPFSFVSTIEELLGRNSRGSGLENREYCRGDRLRWPRDTLYPQKLALTSPTSGGRSVGIVRLRTKATEFVCLCCRVITCHILQESFRTSE